MLLRALYLRNGSCPIFLDVSLVPDKSTDCKGLECCHFALRIMKPQPYAARGPSR
jgi:hypothetical protein